MAKIINGKEISAAIRAEIKENTEKLVQEHGIRPGLAVIIVGEDPASQVYVRNKKRACDEVGFYSESYELPAETTQEELNALVDKLNNIHDRTIRKALVAAHENRYVWIVFDFRKKLLLERLKGDRSVVEECTGLRYGDCVRLVVLVRQRIRLRTRKHDRNALLQRGNCEDERD